MQGVVMIERDVHAICLAMGGFGWLHACIPNARHSSKLTGTTGYLTPIKRWIEKLASLSLNLSH